MTIINAFIAILKKDLSFYARRKGEWILPLLFFLMICSLFSMVFPFNPRRLAEIAPSILWVTLLLATMLSLESVLQSDFKDGSLEQLLLCNEPLSILVLGKVLAHWLAIGLPLTVLSPIFALFFLQVPTETLMGLVLSVSMGMPILSFVGIMAVALTIGLNRGGLFLALLILPLMMPVLILGSSMVYAASLHLPFSGHLALLLAMFILALCFAPLTIAAALRIGVH